MEGMVVRLRPSRLVRRSAAARALAPAVPLPSCSPCGVAQCVEVIARRRRHIQLVGTEGRWLGTVERLGTPEDIANAVAFLVGPDGGWINGQVLRANGGIV